MPMGYSRLEEEAAAEAVERAPGEHLAEQAPMGHPPAGWATAERLELLGGLWEKRPPPRPGSRSGLRDRPSKDSSRR